MTQYHYSTDWKSPKTVSLRDSTTNLAMEPNRQTPMIFFNIATWSLHCGLSGTSFYIPSLMKAILNCWILLDVSSITILCPCFYDCYYVLLFVFVVLLFYRLI